MAGFLLVNPRAGPPRPTVEELVDAARRRGIVTRVLREGDDPVELARRADAQQLGIAGGDGSLAPIAAVAIERDLPFVCVPFGTRNHFARDVGLDRYDPIGALDAYAGPERRIDVGRANDRVFLNNVSFGAYANLVHRREHHRRRREALARVRAWLMLVAHRRRLAITINGVVEEAQLVLVGNNVYVLELPSLGSRERLDAGILALYVVRGAVDERHGRRFALDAQDGRLDAAVDGEPEVLSTPIELRVEPLALRLLVPPGVQNVVDQAVERELATRRKLPVRKPTEVRDVVVGHRLAGPERAGPEQVQRRSPLVPSHPDPEESPDVEREPGFLADLAAQAVERMLPLLDEPADAVPFPLARLERSAGQQHAAATVFRQRARGHRRMRVQLEPAGGAVHAARARRKLVSAAGTELPSGQQRHVGGTMHDQPEATEEEQEQAPERLEEEQEQQAQGHSEDAGPPDDGD